MHVDNVCTWLMRRTRTDFSLQSEIRNAGIDRLFLVSSSPPWNPHQGFPENHPVNEEVAISCLAFIFQFSPLGDALGDFFIFLIFF